MPKIIDDKHTIILPANMSWSVIFLYGHVYMTFVPLSLLFFGQSTSIPKNVSGGSDSQDRAIIE